MNVKLWLSGLQGKDIGTFGPCVVTSYPNVVWSGTVPLLPWSATPHSRIVDVPNPSLPEVRGSTSDRSPIV